MVKGKIQVKAQVNKEGVAASSRGSGGASVSSSPQLAATSKSSTKPRSAANLSMCAGCGICITDDTKALQCDHCQGTEAWKCVDCLHLTTDIYDQLVSDENCSLRWFANAVIGAQWTVV